MQFKLADMAMEIELARNMVLKAAWLKDQDVRYKEAALPSFMPQKWRSGHAISPFKYTEDTGI
ncbi:acyl-CoA dehydrogenase family protein [Bacillus licheniformis]|nr:acyl-CoA dehydrogenase family protein [Bacillus licheniformis]